EVLQVRQQHLGERGRRRPGSPTRGGRVARSPCAVDGAGIGCLSHVRSFPRRVRVQKAPLDSCEMLMRILSRCRQQSIYRAGIRGGMISRLLLTIAVTRERGRLTTPADADD